MPSKNKQPQIPLPKSWDKSVKSGILHVFALAHVKERFRLDSGPDGPKTKTTKIAGLAHPSEWTA